MGMIQEVAVLQLRPGVSRHDPLLQGTLHQLQEQFGLLGAQLWERIDRQQEQLELVLMGDHGAVQRGMNWAAGELLEQLQGVRRG